jgi:hypothetical protein
MRHREKLRQIQPDTTETRLLHFLVEQRRQTVDEKTRESNRLTGCLKLYFPQVLGWFDDVSSPLVRRKGHRHCLSDPGWRNRFFSSRGCGRRRADRAASGFIRAVGHQAPASDAVSSIVVDGDSVLSSSASA